jgi:hypothetical protein
VERVTLVDALDGLRAELAEAVANAQDHDILFPVDGVEIEFQVGLTRSGEGKAGLRFWVVELGGSLAHADQSVQTLRVRLGPPVTRDGKQPLSVSRRSADKP